jgi:hypothetical protein
MALNRNRGMVFSTRSEHCPRAATIEELFGEMFSMRPMPRLRKESIVGLSYLRVLQLEAT